jgi:hypothetical protein
VAWSLDGRRASSGCPSRPGRGVYTPFCENGNSYYPCQALKLKNAKNGVSGETGEVGVRLDGAGVDRDSEWELEILGESHIEFCARQASKLFRQDLSRRCGVLYPIDGFGVVRPVEGDPLVLVICRRSQLSGVDLAEWP